MAEPTCGFNTRSCAFGEASPPRSERARRNKPEPPAAGSLCPVFAFTLPTDKGSSASRYRSTAAASERTSIGSPSAVPVP